MSSQKNYDYVNGEFASKCLLFVETKLNQAAKSGAFDLSESHELYTALVALNKAMPIYNEGQKRLMEFEKPEMTEPTKPQANEPPTTN